LSWLVRYIRGLTPIMPELQPFNELFIEYVQTIFFTNPDKSYGSKEMADGFPIFYRNEDMVKGAIHILLMRGMLYQPPLIPNSSGDSIDQYTAKKESVKALKESKELERKIKRQTFLSLRQQRIITLLSMLIALASLTFAIIKDAVKQQQPIHIQVQTQPQTQINTGQSQIEIHSSPQKAEKDSSY
jgi:hypothetical protein